MLKKQLEDSLLLLKTIFGSDLLGVYLYGSSLLGGLQKYSDVDILVITNRKATLEEKTRLIRNLLEISGIYMKGPKLPIEMTLVEKGAINPWRYPPLFYFQYGEWLREFFEKGTIKQSQTYEMPDLAVILTQVLLKSETLWGLTPEELLPQVPYHDFMKAMLEDLDRLLADLENDTRNVLLTLARIWSTLETDRIRSKPAAADWVIEHLPEMYQPVINRAKSICIGKEVEYWGDIKSLIPLCVDFIVDKIKKRSLFVASLDKTTKIQLTEENFKNSLA